ncbi:MAG TPA: HD domain-containing phosphohydrolase [Pirellulales bacterium]|nr:HD domain-containing phosphohydrolase [Pirellulales bacterium]
MAIDAAPLGATPGGPGAVLAPTSSRRDVRRAQAVRSVLSASTGGQFTLLDPATGELLCVADLHAQADWSRRVELCREVARRGQVEFIEEDDPAIVVALPLAAPHEPCLVAVGAFLSRPVLGHADVARVAALVGCSLDEADEWAARQTPVAPAVLLRLAALAVDKWVAQRTVVQLEDEVEKLSVHLGSTFEEISLLYRVTQNLKLSSNDEELGQRALEWLSEVIPAEGLALQFIAIDDPGQKTPDSRSQPVLLTHGQCQIDNAQFTRLVERLGLSASNRPVVVNRPSEDGAAWAAPGIRELVIVPVAEGGRLFGWLAAFNHLQGLEFGSTEASLINSVGTMLGIHSGNVDLYEQQAEMLLGVVRAMTSAIDAKDPYTRGHSDRVARVAVRLAKELGCDADTRKTLYFSGLLHDIGKIGINDEVLRKPGKLSEAEFEHIKTHVQIGHRILVGLRNMARFLPVVLHHHEAWDGGGYPHGLAGEKIPYLARIVAVADAYDAMASDRPYRSGMDDAKLDAIIRSGAGRQWDPRVVEAFFKARSDIRAISGRDVQKMDAPEWGWS